MPPDWSSHNRCIPGPAPESALSGPGYPDPAVPYFCHMHRSHVHPVQSPPPGLPVYSDSSESG